MPDEANFCGFCGSPLEKSLKDKEPLPIWELLEPSAFLVYSQTICSRIYQVLQIKGAIIEFLHELRYPLSNGTTKIYKNYLYIGKDRRYWIPMISNEDKTFLSADTHSKN